MIYVLLGIVGLGCFVVGVGFEAFFAGRHTEALEHDLFLSEIEVERLKRGGK